jgi:putative Holliday junction resolvase
MSGRPNASSKRAEELAAELERRFGLPVVLWDERLSSAEARRVTAGARGRDKGAVDRVAAALILQSYLDSRR